MAKRANEYLVYGLVCPLAHCVRYVGKSSQGLKRPNQHRTPRSLSADFTYKANWIRKLQAVGLTYEIVVLSRLPTVDALNEAEKFWISYFRDLNYPLTNLTLGGENNVPNEIARRHMSEAQKRIWADPKYRQRMSDVRKNQKHWWGHKISQAKKGRSQRTRRVSDASGVIYPSARAAERLLGLSINAVSRSATSGKPFKNQSFRWID